MSEPYKSEHIYHITDTFDYRAKGKIDGAYTKHRGRLGIRDAGYTFTPALNSIDAGISASEFFTNTQRPDRLIMAVNYAPPDQDKPEGTVDNIRKDFFCAELNNGDIICGTVNGYEFSYLKSEIKNFFRLTNTNKLKSQFRSLEILPEHMLLFADQDRRQGLITGGDLVEVHDLDKIIPNVPDTTHVHEVDNFQNVKLFPSINDLNLLRELDRQKVSFQFGEASIEATDWHIRMPESYDGLVTPTLFAAAEKITVVALRSSSQRVSSDPGNCSIPIIATLRQLPAESDPDYTPPKAGAAVWLKPKALDWHVA